MGTVGITVGRLCPMMGWMAPGAQEHNHCPWQAQRNDVPQLPHLVLEAHDRLDHEAQQPQVLLCPRLCLLPGELAFLCNPGRDRAGGGVTKLVPGVCRGNSSRAHTPDIVGILAELPLALQLLSPPLRQQAGMWRRPPFPTHACTGSRLICVPRNSTVNQGGCQRDTWGWVGTMAVGAPRSLGQQRCCTAGPYIQSGGGTNWHQRTVVVVHCETWGPPPGHELGLRAWWCHGPHHHAPHGRGTWVSGAWAWGSRVATGVAEMRRGLGVRPTVPGEPPTHLPCNALTRLQRLGCMTILAEARPGDNLLHSCHRVD